MNRSAASNQQRAIDLAFEGAMAAGDDHKQWYFDQIIRVLAGDSYDALVRAWEHDLDDPDDFEPWDTGVAP